MLPWRAEATHDEVVAYAKRESPPHHGEPCNRRRAELSRQCGGSPPSRGMKMAFEGVRPVGAERLVHPGQGPSLGERRRVGRFGDGLRARAFSEIRPPRDDLLIEALNRRMGTTGPGGKDQFCAACAGALELSAKDSSVPNPPSMRLDSKAMAGLRECREFAPVKGSVWDLMIAARAARARGSALPLSTACRYAAATRPTCSYDLACLVSSEGALVVARARGAVALTGDSSNSEDPHQRFACRARQDRRQLCRCGLRSWHPDFKPPLT